MPSHRRPRRLRASTAGLTATLTAAATVLVGASAVGTAAAAEIYYPSGTMEITGHGNGHGKGMSQYGAYGMAADGKNYEQILDFYYPGTVKETTVADPSHVLRVNLTGVDENLNTMIALQPDQPVHVAAVNWKTGVEDASPAAFDIELGKPDPNGNPGNIAYVSADRRNGVTLLSYATVEHPENLVPYLVGGKQFATSDPIRFTNAKDPVHGLLRLMLPWAWNGSKFTAMPATDYHGYLEARWDGDKCNKPSVPKSADRDYVCTINGVTLADYLPGVVPREMPASFTPGGSLEALKAQAVAARSFAIVQKAAGGTFDLYDTESSQVYSGVQRYDFDKHGVYGPTPLHEEPNTTKAVRDTAGETRSYGGKTISAMFSSSNGGYTVGDPKVPYFVAKPDPNDGYKNPNATWIKDLSTSTIASKYGVGNLQSITINSRDGHGDWGGRIQSMTIKGSTKSVTVTGDNFRSTMGLMSTLWTSGTVPGPPAAVTAAGKNGYATVSWTPPSSDGQNDITGYTVRANPGGKTVTVSAGTRSVTVPNLDNGTKYTFTVTATNKIGTGAGTTATATPTLATSAFHTAGPARVFDSRSAKATLGAKTVREVRVAGVHGIPSGVTGVALNVTVTNTTASSYLTVYAKIQGRPTASNVNWTAGQTVPNLVEVPVAPDGTIELYNEAGRADVIVDVFGYYTPATSADPGDVLVGATPRRIFDTRTGAGGPKAKLGAGQSRNLAVAGANGVPANATAVVANLTATGISAPSFLTAWPAGASRPGTSSLNMAKGQTRSNAVVLPLGTSGANKGKLSVYNDKGSTDVIVDVLGWYVPASSADAPGQFAPIQPARLLDTRSTLGGHKGALGAKRALQFQVTGRGGVPASSVSAVALNVTAVSPSAATFVTAYPSGASRPFASNLNAPARTTVANMVIVPVGSGGKVSLYNDAGSTNLVVDVLGWYSS